MSSAWGILAVSSDVAVHLQLASILSRLSCDPICAQDIEQAVGLLQERPIGLVFCDWNLSDGSYRDLLKALRALKTQTRLVVTSRLADWDQYLESMRLGAFDMITTPCSPPMWNGCLSKRTEKNGTKHARARIW